MELGQVPLVEYVTVYALGELALKSIVPVVVSIESPLGKNENVPEAPEIFGVGSEPEVQELVVA